MPKAMHPAPLFIADHHALDFLNSLATPQGKTIEWLSNGAALLDWLEQAKMIPISTLEWFKQKELQTECDEIAAQARHLREWFRVLINNHAGQSKNFPEQSEIEYLNQLLVQTSHYYQIEIETHPTQNTNKEETSLLWKQYQQWNAPGTLLFPLTEAIGQLICLNNFQNIKQCKGARCTLWFLDVSHNHTRQWCSMSVCGNRAKAAAHREKKKLANHSKNKMTKNQ